MKGVDRMLCAAALALTLGLAGCGPVDGDPIRPAPGSAGQSSSTAASDAEDTEPEQLAALRQLAGEDGELAGMLYLGRVPERTADVDAALDSLQEQPWQFVTEGTAKVFWISGSDKAVTLIETTGTYSDTITLPDGGNYIGIECEDFTGNIELNIE